ncbi:MAG: D-alanyl-D-alanine carboxypeptidase, partial [Eggerthellaceae bacterium]|nr:D-alanyl-D-alanine carboxypeptidase [Eggerthellaceae bacterium]
DGTLYFERNSLEPRAIASITKIMTAIVTLEYANSTTLIHVSYRATQVGESSANLVAGDILTLDAALKALLLSSGNDASVAIAETIGELISGGTATGAQAEAVFVDTMNAQAEKMGLLDTVFRNPHGLDDGGFEGDHHSCAVDVGNMVRYAMQNKDFRAIVATSQTSITLLRGGNSTVTLNLENTDQLLGNYEGACGVKTGFTDLAGPSFVGAANREGREFYAIVLGSSSHDQRFIDAQILLNWAFDHCIEYPLVHSSRSMEATIDGQKRNVPIVAEVAHADWIDKTVKATLRDPDQVVEIFSLNGNINQTVQYDTLRGNIKVGDKVGTITFKQRNEVLVTVDMIACEAVKAPGLFEGIGIWWDRIFRGLSGEQTVAHHVLVNQTPLVNQKGGS